MSVKIRLVYSRKPREGPKEPDKVPAPLEEIKEAEPIEKKRAVGKKTNKSKK